MLFLVMLFTITMCHFSHAAQEAPPTIVPQEENLFIVPIIAKQRPHSLVFIQKNNNISDLDALRNPAKKFITHGIVLQSEQQIEHFVRTKGSSEDTTSFDKVRSGELTSHTIPENPQQLRAQFFMGQFHQDIVKDHFNQKSDTLHKIL